MLAPFGGDVGGDLAIIRQPVQRLEHQAALALQVVNGYQLLVWMFAQPARAEPQQLVHLVVAHPVVLGVVQHGKQHVEVGQQVPQPHHPLEAHTEAGTGSPLGEAHIQRAFLDFNGVAQRLEQPANEVGSLPGREGGQLGLQWDRLLRQLGPVPAVAGQRAVEYRGNRQAEVGRSDVGAVVHVVMEPPGSIGRTGIGAHQFHRVDLQQEGGGAAVCVCHGIEDVSPPEGQRERLESPGVLVQQISQVRGRAMCGGNGEQHIPNGTTPPHRRTRLRTWFSSRCWRCGIGRRSE